MVDIPVRSEQGISADDVQPGWSDSDQSGISGTGFAVRNLHSSLLLAALKPLGTEKQAFCSASSQNVCRNRRYMEEAVTGE